ncbi:hypothetical protein J3F83DRAFT_439786 [Trichoderma novae-zelandiae]
MPATQSSHESFFQARRVLRIAPGRAGVSIADEVHLTIISSPAFAARQMGHHSPCRFGFPLGKLPTSARLPALLHTSISATCLDGHVSSMYLVYHVLSCVILCLDRVKISGGV